MQLYWSAVPASIAALTADKATVTADNAAVTADNAAAKICFHIGHVNQQVTASWEWLAVALQRLPLLGERLPLPQEAV